MEHDAPNHNLNCPTRKKHQQTFRLLCLQPVCVVADLGLVITNDALRIGIMSLPRRGKVADIIICVLQREIYNAQVRCCKGSRLLFSFLTVARPLYNPAAWLSGVIPTDGPYKQRSHIRCPCRAFGYPRSAAAADLVVKINSQICARTIDLGRHVRLCTWTTAASRMSVPYNWHMGDLELNMFWVLRPTHLAYQMKGSLFQNHVSRAR